MQLNAGIIILGLGGLAFLAGLGAWIWELLQNRKKRTTTVEPDILGAAVPSKPKVELPLKTPSSPPSQIDETKSPFWAKTFPSLSSHKKEYGQKIQEPSTDLPKAVKHQSPLPEFGGMCNKCGEKPKVPGNDGFCADCSELG